jgi:hypothetical protein
LLLPLSSNSSYIKTKLFNRQNLPIRFFTSFQNTIGEPYTKKANKKQTSKKRTNKCKNKTKRKQLKKQSDKQPFN